MLKERLGQMEAYKQMLRGGYKGNLVLEMPEKTDGGLTLVEYDHHILNGTSPFDQDWD